MKILANYSYKNNDDTYSVTFETMSNAPKEQADTVVDELFAMAKRAIEHQFNPQTEVPTQTDTLGFPPKEEVTIPQPKQNGNGNPHLKDPDAPATKKQKNLIIRLAKEKGQYIENLNSLTMQEASSIIDELMVVEA
ncbi:MAG: hypothetical protein Q8O13_10740 [Candidatus Omnitrophota bacterium]|nr:hypothetical protein [Candidatus Omnitrophota bacterium]